ncbi:MAG: FGGY family carbohydrate kinase [Steroidobacteraceae bacterium]
MRAILALDQGSHASRACLVDEQGVLRAQHSVAVATQRHPNGHIEQDPLELQHSLVQAIAALCQAHPQTQWVAAGLATQRSTLLCCERASLEPLTPALSWQDRRHGEWLAQFEPQQRRIRAITGLPLSPHYGVAKLRWCLDRDARVRQAADAERLLATPLSAWLQARLTSAAPRVDPANAARTLLYDSATLDWSEELLDRFGIRRSWLPACGTTVAAFGTLPLPGASVPLRAVSGDQSVVPFGFGPVDTGTLYINLGTGAFLQRAATQRPTHPEPLLGSVLYADAKERRYSIEGTVNGAGSALANFCSDTGAQEALLWPLFERLDPSATVPLFINGVGGLGSPFWRSQLDGGFLGAGSQAERFAAVVESILFLIAINARLLARHGALERIIVAGGLSRSAGLCRRLAALLQLPVLRGELEASARGVAALAAPELARHWPAPGFERFDPQSLPALQARSARFEAELQLRLAPRST